MNAIVTLDPAFQAPASAAFQGIDAADDLSGGITGGYGMLRIRGKVWAIHYRDIEQQLMRADGDGPQGSVEVVILKANPHLSKTWYENGWDENSANPPDCSSANGVTPDAGVPKPQSNVCATCPRNQWGTAANGGKGKACGDHRRLAVTPAMDIPNEMFGGPMLLRCPAASLQDLATFDSKYKQAGYPYFSMVVKIAFDPKESYPKLIFSAVRPLNDQEAQTVLALRNSDAVARVIADQQVQAPVQQVAAPQQALFSNAPAGAQVAAAMAPAVAQPAPNPVATAPIAAATQPTPVQQAPQPAQQVQGSAFGGAVSQPVQQQPAPQPAPQAAPQAQPRQMAAFGGSVVTPQSNPQPNTVQQAAPQTVQQPVQQPVQQAAAQQPVQQAAPVAAPQPAQTANPAFDASLDEKLAALLGGGAPA